MSGKKREHSKEKAGLHRRNKHRERYDFKLLQTVCPGLGQFVKLNNYGDESIDFFNPEAVKLLNQALLKYYYSIDYWDIPENYLCPPIPGRADYLHHAADLLYRNDPGFQKGRIPKGAKLKCLDIGVGANCVYPIIGNKEYGWSFIGSDIDPVSIESARKIIELNPSLKGKIDLRIQNNPKNIFQGIIQKDELIDLSVCNPPFHDSFEEALYGTVRKLNNLKNKRVTNPVLNFSGQNNELWCEGGEEKFITDMIYESRHFSASCLLFSTLVSKQSSLKIAYKALNIVQASEIQVIPMSHGNKVSRILFWTFLTIEQQNKWINERW